MYLMFVDESGDPGYPKKSGNWTGWKGTKVFVRVGLIIHGWKWKSWNERMVSFKRNRGLLWDTEIKASDMRRGRKAFAGWPQNQREQLLLERYNQFLHRQKDKAGIVVLDPTKELDDDNLRYFQSFLQSQAPHFKPLHIVEGTFFAKSHTSNMIQLADYCANVFFREVTRRDNSDEWQSISQRFDRVDRKVTGIGIKHWPP